MSSQLHSFEYAYEMAGTFTQKPDTSQEFFDVLMFFYEYNFADCLIYASDYWKYLNAKFVVFNNDMEDE
jgi:hypothetical protein